MISVVDDHIDVSCGQTQGEGARQRDLSGGSKRRVFPQRAQLTHEEVDVRRARPERERLEALEASARAAGCSNEGPTSGRY